MKAFSSVEEQAQENDQAEKPLDTDNLKVSGHSPAPISVSLSLAAAIRAHKKGKMEKAVQIYSGILRKYPDHADANYLLGVAAFERGLKEDAISMIERAIASEPDNAAYYGKLGEIFTLLGYVERADQAYAKAAELAPGDVRFHLGRAQIMERNGEIDKARDQYLSIIKKWPDEAECHYRFAAIEARSGDRELARKHASKALKINDKYADSHFLYALLSAGSGDVKAARNHFAMSSKCAPEKSEIHMKAAKKLMQVHDYDHALSALYRQTKSKPDDFVAFCLMGQCLSARGEHEGAVVSFDRALEFKIDYVAALTGKAMSLVKLNHVADAFESAQKAVQFQPDNWECQMVLGLVYRENDQPVDAIDVLNKAVRLAPNEPKLAQAIAEAYQENLEINHALHYAREAFNLAPKNKEIEMTLARCCLQSEEWVEGWHHFEARKPATVPFKALENLAQWDGSEKLDQRLLVYVDGTKSDGIQFARFLKLAKSKVADLYLYCPKDMARLFSALDGVSGVIPHETLLPRVDVISPLKSLPKLLSINNNQSMSMTKPYIEAVDRDVEKWREKLAKECTGKAVGLVWQGDKNYKGDKRRSPGIWPFSRLFYMRNIDFFGLQVGNGSDVLSDPQLSKVVRNFAIDLLDFADTAALIEALDLVVTCDTAVAHLAGAMNKPVWMVAPYGVDWRWGMLAGTEAEKTFWYPSMRIYRQAEPGDWADVFARIGLALDHFVSENN